jgi:hypothetical protein
MFSWSYADGEGNDLGDSRHFPDQAAAEAWMAEAWEGLRERGVEAVSLIDVETDRRIYRMGLDPAER